MRALWPGARLVVPGIRLPGDLVGDQARVDTPAAAVHAGATDLVVGRAIVESDKPREALARYLSSLKTGGTV
jgi:orotidine-5'-phosphate decarboxylase